MTEISYVGDSGVWKSFVEILKYGIGPICCTRLLKQDVWLNLKAYAKINIFTLNWFHTFN